MYKIALLILLFLPANSLADQIRIGVFDTGYTKPSKQGSVNLCKDGHYDSSTDTGTVGSDVFVGEVENHGTNIAHIIDDRLKPLGKDKYCLVIFKIYGNHKSPIRMSINALKKVKKAGVSYINYSSAGDGSNKEESETIKDLLNHGVRIVASAGNEGLDLRKNKRYPAMYDERIIVVGNGSSCLTRVPSSNYGTSVKYWKYGNNILAGGSSKSGTSQSAAIFTANMIHDSIVYGRK